jgi:hypothetical protein
LRHISEVVHLVDERLDEDAHLGHFVFQSRRLHEKKM